MEKPFRPVRSYTMRFGLRSGCTQHPEDPYRDQEVIHTDDGLQKIPIHHKTRICLVF